MEMVKTGANRKMVNERLNNMTIERIDSSELTFQLTGEIFISSADIYSGLKMNAIKLVIRIQQELEMNNPLWECTDKHKREVRAALAQLKAADILESIEGTDVFLINPLKIRKGKPLSIYGSIYEYAKRMHEKDPHWKPTTEDIRRLKAPEKVMLIPEVIINPHS